MSDPSLLKGSPFLLKGSTIMRISVLVSLLLHVMLVFAFRDAFSSHWVQEDLRIYRVELIRPPTEQMDTDETPDAHVAEDSQEDKAASPADGQDTISLDTTDKRYVSYARALRERIMAEWEYPSAAKENLIEGKLIVVFSLGKQGNLSQIRVAESSGYDILDREATRAISSAAPFPHFPDHVTVSRLNVKASFDYRIKAKK